MGVKRTYKVRSLDTHDFDSDPDLTGVVMSIESMEVDGEERPFMTIDTGDRTVRVFHSKALEDAFKAAEEGDHIHIAYRGKIKLKGGKKTFRRYECQVWTEESDGQEETSE